MSQHDPITRHVTAVHLLQAIQLVRRQGVNVLMQMLETDEPELTEHLLEELTALHHQLYRQGLPHKQLARTTPAPQRRTKAGRRVAAH